MLPSLIGSPPEGLPKANARTRVRAMLAAPGRIQGLRTIAYRTVMGVGVCAIGAMGTMFVKPELTDHIKAMSPFAQREVQHAAVVVPAAAVTLGAGAPDGAARSAASHAPASAAVEDASQIEAAARMPAPDQKEVAPREQKFVTNWLSKRYRVAGDATNMLVSATYRTAREVKIDPLLVLAVMAIESGFNPFAESPVGAQGLMQVMAKVHHDKFQPLGGVKAALNPVANIKVGATILKEYVSRGGSVESGLKMYVGAAAFENDAGYGYKVLAEYKRLKEVASGKMVPVTTATTATVAAKTAPKAVTQPVANEKVDALTQVARPDQDGGIVAAL